jgi:hypothetical protein
MRRTHRDRLRAARGDAALAAVEQRMTAGLTDTQQQQQLLELLTTCIANLEPDAKWRHQNRATYRWSHSR